MEQIKGKGISEGIAIGRVCIINEYKIFPEEIHLTEDEEWSKELEKYKVAREKVVSELKVLYVSLLDRMDKAAASIFEAQILLVNDEEFISQVNEIIELQRVKAVYAVKIVADKLKEQFLQMDDEYFSARATDIKDVSDRLIKALFNIETLHNIDIDNNDAEENIGQEIIRQENITEESVPDNNTLYKNGRKYIIASEELTPSETVKFERSKISAFLTKTGTSNSHVAILARTMNIPAVSGVDISEKWDGKLCIIDGNEGLVIINPGDTTIKIYEEKLNQIEKEQEKLKGLILKENTEKSAKCGKESDKNKSGRIKVCANIGNIEDVKMALENGAEGIGLLRSEFLYIGRKDFPTEEEQFEFYKRVAESMAGKQVIIRTLDIGADKRADYFRFDKEDNPALGYRGVRVSLDRPDIFKTQLRAIYRASAFGNVSVMYPMITSLEEVRQIKKIVREVEAELEAAEITYGNMEQGIMIETPAAAIISDELAKEVDFFSIGTNDLTQYTLAMDRQNSKLEGSYDSHHKAILRLIKYTVESAHKAGIWVGICGELAADMALTEEFVKMGVNELSVAPSYILELRKKQIIHV